MSDPLAPQAGPVSLRLKRAPTGSPLALVFGGSGGGDPGAVGLRHHVALPPLRASARVASVGGLVVSVALPGLGATMRVPTITEVRASAALPSLHATHLGAYDNRVSRWLETRVAAPHDAATSAMTLAAVPWADAHRERRSTAMPWSRARAQHTGVAVPAQAAQAVRAIRAPAWQVARPLAALSAVASEVAQPMELRSSMRWQVAEQLSVELLSAMQVGAARRAMREARWGVAREVRPTWSAPMGASVRRSMRLAAGAWQVARPAPAGRSELPVAPPVAPSTNVADLLFKCPPVGAPLVLLFGRSCDTSGPDALVVVPIRRYYMVINSVELHRVDTGAELRAHAFSMSVDADSWTWSWRATLERQALPHVLRAAGGDPVEVEAVVNGVPYRLLVGDVGRDRAWPTARITVSGRGLAAELDAPWVPEMSFGSAEARTAQQLMAEALTLNGVPLGWDLDWRLQDWLVPGGAWTLRGSHIAAVNDIAGAAGGYVQPHPTARTLRILPRYPVAPWDWSGLTPEIELPMAAAEVESIKWVDRAAYDRVFVGGISAGVHGPVTRTGTGGTLIAPPVTHALITAPEVHQQRGRAELSNTGRQAHVELKLQVLPSTGIIQPGTLVRYMAEDGPMLGLVRSTAVDWQRPLVRQTIGIETHA